MTTEEWLMLMCFAVGFTQGLYVGWVLWRNPNLKYKGVDDANS